jgi:hypothetical protein
VLHALADAAEQTRQRLDNNLAVTILNLYAKAQR